jgi:anti-anti-sigma factor
MYISTPLIPAEFGVSVYAHGYTTVVALAGEADLSTLAALADAFSRVIIGGRGDVVVDLAELEFMDTATLRAVLAAKAVLADAGRGLTLRSPSGIAGRMLAVFGLTDLVRPPITAGRVGRHPAQPSFTD